MSKDAKQRHTLTEMGFAQHEWRRCDLSELCGFQQGFFISAATKTPGNVPVYSSSGQSYFHNEAKLKPPAVITGRKGVLGKVFYVNTPCWPHDTTFWVKDFKGNDPEFVYWLLTHIGLDRFDTASSVPTLNKNNLVGIPISLPSLPEQRAIVTILSDNDALISGLDELIVKKRDIKQAAMQQLLTGQRRLPGFSEEWDVKRLGDVLSRMAGGATYKPDEKNGVPITRIETIATGTIDLERVGRAAYSSELDQYRIEIGDILFSRTNSIGHIGKVARFEGGAPLYHGMNLLLLRPSSTINSKFLYMLLSSEFIRRKMTLLAKQAVGQASINRAELKDVELLVPTLKEQAAIATVLTDMDNDLENHEVRFEKACHLKQGMMQELLTDKCRLSHM